jgi:hypothetical protein
VPKAAEPEQTPIQKEAENIMSMDIIQDLDDMIREIVKLIKNNGGMEALQASLIRQI